METPMTGLARSNLVVASGTAVSRLTGLIRIVIFGIIVGQTSLADAFDSANNSPNAIYELLIGGVLSASLVALFAQFVERDDLEHNGTKSQDAIISVSAIALVAVTALAMLFAPAIFHILSLHPASSVNTQVFRSVGTSLTRIFVVQIFFYGLSALTSALLNARKLFFAAAWSPALANIVTIGFFCLLPLTQAGDNLSIDSVQRDQVAIWILGLGTTLGIVVMALAQGIAVLRHGMRFTFSPQFTHPAVKKLVRLSLWTLGYVAANQVALVVIKNLASPGSGGVDAYSKAFVLLQLPHGLLAVSIATTFVPDLARMFHRGDHQQFSLTMANGIRLTALLTIPASCGLWVMSKPIIGLLFQHGNFSAAATANTARALCGLAIGLAGFSIYLFVLRGFYARNDTRTPFFINVAENAINIVLAIMLVNRHGVYGLGLSFSIAYLVSALIALLILERTEVDLNLAVLAFNIVRIAIAAGVMTYVVWFLIRYIGGEAGVGALTRVAAGTMIGAATYAVALSALGEKSMRSYLSSKITKSSR
jgi:putative peptidoglycan lipid II flippase